MTRSNEVATFFGCSFFNDLRLLALLIEIFSLLSSQEEFVLADSLHLTGEDIAVY